MYTLERNEFNILEKYVVTKGDNYNGDRCFTLYEKNSGADVEITMCMNELNSAAQICVVDGEDIDKSKCLIEIFWVHEMLERLKNVTYTEEEEEKYIDYMDNIKMLTECCNGDCANCNNL